MEQRNTDPRNPSLIEDSCKAIEKEIVEIDAVIDRLTEKLTPVRIKGGPENEEINETGPSPERSPVGSRLEALRLAVMTERRRLEDLANEVQV